MIEVARTLLNDADILQKMASFILHFALQAKLLGVKERTKQEQGNDIEDTADQKIRVKSTKKRNGYEASYTNC